MTALLGFVFFGLFSPGPNVILLTASGARFGFRPTVPHLVGVACGVGVTAFVTGLGLGAALQAMPGVRFSLMVAASVWILWMAWRLWHASPASVAEQDRPFTFIEAVLFQWINPKIWAVAMAATVYVEGATPVTQATTLAVVFSGTNLFVCLFWTGAGTLLSALRHDPVKWRIFMRSMAVALATFSLLVFM